MARAMGIIATACGALTLGGCFGDAVDYAELVHPSTGRNKGCMKIHSPGPIDIGGHIAAAQRKVDECVEALEDKGYVVVRRTR